MSHYCSRGPIEELAEAFQEVGIKYNLSEEQLAVLALRIGADFSDPGRNIFDGMRDMVNQNNGAWTKHNNNNYSAEYSALSGSRQLGASWVTTPEGPVEWSEFRAFRDADNDITHWTATAYKHGYTIWND